MTYLFKKPWLALAVSCLLILAACGQGGKEKETAGADGEGETKKVLNVGTEATFAPFEFMDKGVITGFDIDLLNAVAEEAGYEVKIENTGWDSMLAGLQGKQLDIGAAGITIDEERLKTYDFSVPYFQSISMIAFKEGTDVKSAEDLKNLKIGVQNGTTGQFAAEKVVGTNNKNISKYETAALMFQALQSDNVDAVVTDNAVALEYEKNNPESGVKTLVDEDQFESEYYGLAFPKGSELKADFDKALNTVFDNGKYAEIYQKWFSDKEPNIENLKDAAKDYEGK